MLLNLVDGWMNKYHIKEWDVITSPCPAHRPIISHSFVFLHILFTPAGHQWLINYSSTDLSTLMIGEQINMSERKSTKKLEQLERLRSEIPPTTPWLLILVIHIRSQVKTRQSQSCKFLKFGENSNFEILQETLHAVYLLKLLDKDIWIWHGSNKNCRCYRAGTGCGMDGRTDGQTDRVKPIYPPTTSLCRGYNNKVTSHAPLNSLFIHWLSHDMHIAQSDSCYTNTKFNQCIGHCWPSICFGTRTSATIMMIQAGCYQNHPNQYFWQDVQM